APYFLHFDGVDDFMQTASADFTGTDEVTVCAGVRKLSDVATGVLFDLSVNPGTNNGAFSFNLPGSPVSKRVNWISRGNGTSQEGTATGAAYDAPLTCVATGVGKINSDTANLRVNGTQFVGT